MARIRTVKPEFFRHEGLQDLETKHPKSSPMLVFAGLWTTCDREGRFIWRPRTLKLDILPFLDFDMAQTLDILAAANFIEKYELYGEVYGAITQWARHQLPGRDEPESGIPGPHGKLTQYIRPPNTTVRARIYERDGYRCLYCKVDLSNQPRLICLDHVIPYTDGGTNSEENLATACKRCNANKGARAPDAAGMPWPTSLGEAYVDGVPTTIHQGMSGWSTGGQPPHVTEGVRGGGVGRDGVKSTVGLKPDAIAVLQFLNEKTARNYQPVSANVDLIVARLKDGATVEDLRAVIAKKAREWKGDEKMDLYLRPATLFNRTKFAQYQGELGKAAP